MIKLRIVWIIKLTAFTNSFEYVDRQVFDAIRINRRCCVDVGRLIGTNGGRGYRHVRGTLRSQALMRLLVFVKPVGKDLQHPQ
ncbi:hypothetical protein D6R50_10805 [Aeromonas veronii]|uniref:Uncharacterized protein n=1 Tax=Aeromonas veronii TaxID=654 RepID=A0A3A9IDC9_AERVE|nr:hypothetical protein D6R50_06630 [Aeromonas veronii]RKJ89719.1 hypothetical protein D6R50_10805 [Aeromonas veronii]